MVSPDNSSRWAQNIVKSGRAATARPAADGSAIAILTDGEEAYEILYDSRDDRVFRVPTEFKSYYLSKRLPDANAGKAQYIPGTRLYHEHIGADCSLGLQHLQSGADQPDDGVAPVVQLKALKKRRRGSRGRKR
jgi:hypothetical protein